MDGFSTGEYDWYLYQLEEDYLKGLDYEQVYGFYGQRLDETSSTSDRA